MEVVFIPQITVFLKEATYLAIARKAGENHTTGSALLRKLAEKKYGGGVP